MGSATQWLFNFVVTKFTPEAINNIGWRTFIMFGVFCFAMGIWVLFFVKETKGRSLEDMDALFGGNLLQQAVARKDVESTADAAEYPEGEKETAKHEEQVR